MRYETLETLLDELHRQKRCEEAQRERATRFINNVLDLVEPLTGRRKPFTFQDEPGSENASAPVCSLGELTFDFLWIGRDLLPNYSKWAVTSVVLHEVAHTVDCRSRHGQKSSWNMEHFADETAGYYAGRLGFSLIGVERFFFNELDGFSESHPPAASRYRRFLRGYNRGLLDRL